jgi:hypothetical protein
LLQAHSQVVSVFPKCVTAGDSLALGQTPRMSVLQAKNAVIEVRSIKEEGATALPGQW